MLVNRLDSSKGGAWTSLRLRQDGLNADGGWNPELMGATSFSVWLWWTAKHPSTPGTLAGFLHTEVPISHWGCCGQRRSSTGDEKGRKKMGLEKERNLFSFSLFLKTQVLSPVWIFSKSLNSKEFCRGEVFRLVATTDWLL